MSKEEQVVVISPDGKMKSTHLRKNKKGLDLTKLGKAKIDRASDIVWLEEQQMWGIKLLEGSHAGEMVNIFLWCETCGFIDPKTVVETVNTGILDKCIVTKDSVLILATPNYEDTVTLEVFFLNHYRLKESF